MTELELVSLAWQAREKARAPYSRYAVGAALLCGDGEVVTGANVESASYGLSICAERVALFKAVTSGQRTFTAIAVVADGRLAPVPCGACRQVLGEYAPAIRVLLSKKPGEFEGVLLTELIPRPFTADFLQ